MNSQALEVHTLVEEYIATKYVCYTCQKQDTLYCESCHMDKWGRMNKQTAGALIRTAQKVIETHGYDRALELVKEKKILLV